MDMKKVWICGNCEDVHEESEACPVCGETNQISLKDTKLGTIGFGEECVRFMGRMPRRPGNAVFIPGQRFGNRFYPALTFGLTILPLLREERQQIEAGHGGAAR